jgi:hypothetical protein
VNAGEASAIEIVLARASRRMRLAGANGCIGGLSDLALKRNVLSKSSPRIHRDTWNRPALRFVLKMAMSLPST